MEEVVVKELREIKTMISGLSDILLKVLDMEIEPVLKDEISDEEKKVIQSIASGKEKLLTKEELERYLSE
ncbi:MAG: hypothetical protein V3T58_07285 [Candidatus Hydrothermarchaeales archaeon]